LTPQAVNAKQVIHIAQAEFATALLGGCLMLPFHADAAIKHSARSIPLNRQRREENISSLSEVARIATRRAVSLGKPDMTRFLGGLDVGFAIPGMGVFVGPNLTPDKQTGLGNWTDDQVVIALTTGQTPDGHIILLISGACRLCRIRSADLMVLARTRQNSSWSLSRLPFTAACRNPEDRQRPSHPQRGHLSPGRQENEQAATKTRCGRGFGFNGIDLIHRSKPVLVSVITRSPSATGSTTLRPPTRCLPTPLFAGGLGFVGYLARRKRNMRSALAI
jgi:hypothetical protein